MKRIAILPVAVVAVVLTIVVLVMTSEDGPPMRGQPDVQDARRAAREQRRRAPTVSPPEITIPPLDAELPFVAETGPADTTLSGTVLTPAGNPLENALVTLCRSSGGSLFLALSLERVKEPVLTDRQGRFLIPNIKGGDGYGLRVEHGAYAPAEISGLVIEKHESNRVQDIVLSSGVEIHGVVTRADGVSIAGAVLAAVNLASRSPDAVRQVITDEKGTYDLIGLAPGVYEVIARAEGLQTVRSAPIHIMTAPARKKQDFVLAEGLVMRGRVVAVGREAVPIPGATISARLMRGTQPSCGSSTSGADGRFAITGLADGDYLVEVKRKGFAPQTRTSVEACNQKVRFSLVPTVGVTGFVVKGQGAAESPVKSFGLRVWKLDRKGQRSFQVGDLRTFTSADGSFTIEDLETGSYQFQAYANGFAPTYCHPFEVRNVFVHGLKIRMNEGACLSGTVTDSRGSPLVGATVKLLDNAYRDIPLAAIVFDKYTRLGRTTTDESGAFRFPALAAGTYQVQVSAPDMLTRSECDIKVGARGDATCGPFVMTEGGHLSGTVFDSRSLPANGAKISLVDSVLGLLKEVRANDDGEFSFRNLAPGSYRLIALPNLAAENPGNIFVATVQATKAAVEVTVQEGQTSPVTIYLRT